MKKEVDLSTNNDTNDSGRRKKYLVEERRFEKFVLLIDGLHKCINKAKNEIAPPIDDIKGVHLFWIYELLLHPEGLTATEIATVSMIDRSLVSREIESLKRNGYVATEDAGNKRNYNSRNFLTEKGVELAKKIADSAMLFQSKVGEGIPDEELCAFYTTLEKLYDNFFKLTSQSNKKSN